MKNFSNRVRNIEASLIRQMPVWAAKIKGVVSLGQGVPSFDFPEYIREKLIEALKTQKDINKYSLQPGMPALKEEVAKYLKQTRNIKVNPEKEIAITTGAIAGLFCAIAALVEKGDEVILFNPCYGPHIEQVKFAQGKPVFAPLLEKEGWRPDFAALKKAVTKKTKAIILCDPANPTGSIFRKEDLIEIAKIAQKNKLFLITDETYDFLIYDQEKHFSLLSFPETRDRIVACFSFSKKYAMTGFRVGYVYAKEPILNQILKVHDESNICAPTISQYAALFALQGPQDYVEKFRLEFEKRRNLICKRLEKIPELFEYQKPKGAYYILPKFKLNLNSKDFGLELLKKAKVVAIPGSAFGPGGEGHIRFSFAGKEQIINEAFDRIDKYWKEIK